MGGGILLSHLPPLPPHTCRGKADRKAQLANLAKLMHVLASPDFFYSFGGPSFPDHALKYNCKHPQNIILLYILETILY